MIGAITGFHSNMAFVCGGAREQYADCTTHVKTSQICFHNVLFNQQYIPPYLQNIGTKTCETNTDCVSTLGGSRWCTGPKSDECLVYDATLTKQWQPVAGFKLKKPRAFAAVVQLPDGRFWVLGGITRDTIEDSTEFIEYDKKAGEWKVKNGPKMTGPRFGHCAMMMDDREVRFFKKFGPCDSRLLFLA